MQSTFDCASLAWRTRRFMRRSQTFSASIAIAATFAIGQYPPAQAQGVVHFNNRVAGVVDARVVTVGNNGAGPYATAQLFGGPAGTPHNLLAPLFPKTTFRSSSAAAMGYLIPVDVVVPGVLPGQEATLVMRVYVGESFEMTPGVCRFESNLITIVLGGGLLPPANLVGLRPMTAMELASPLCIPEPGTLILASLGLTALAGFLHRRRICSRP